MKAAKESPRQALTDSQAARASSRGSRWRRGTDKARQPPQSTARNTRKGEGAEKGLRSMVGLAASHWKPPRSQTSLRVAYKWPGTLRGSLICLIPNV